jgi:undecaprenyl phosphate N,N'-diacetylbacillosamine 1-phosphate transferase
VGTYCGKRAFDLSLAAAAAVIFAPLIAAVAAAIWLDDQGAPLFRQPRIGGDRNLFTILKFRSMKNGRVTRVGAWLRRSAIDELPQFINVCRGEMSVVGPRALTGYDVERLGWSGTSHDWRFAVKPGITGLSQLLAGRGSRSSERLDKLYLRRQSLSLDLQLVALSFAVNLLGKKRVRRWMRRQGDPHVA